MKRTHRFLVIAYAYVQFLSLDVVLGSLGAARMAQRVLGAAPLAVWHYAALGAAVFVAYALDRLYDIRKEPVPTTPRHRFFVHHPKIWLPLTGLAVLVGAYSAWQLPWRVQGFGLVLTGLSGGYLWLAQRRRAPARAHWFEKEPFVATLYTLGIWGSVWVSKPIPDKLFGAVVLGFGGIAFANLLLFSSREVESDAQSGQPSLARRWGLRRTGRIFFLTLGLVLSLVLVVYMARVVQPAPRPYVFRAMAVLAAMAIAMGVIFLAPWFKKRARYRAWGDAVFWLAWWV